jgi:5-methylcytosine-specific restriction endonuclease McrA
MSRWKENKPNPYLDPAWKKLSSQIRSKRPWCEICGTARNLTVDHLDPISKGGPLLAPEHRLRVLCRQCHGRLTKHK